MLAIIGKKMPKTSTPLIDRMRKREGIPEAWITEVYNLLREIDELKRERDEYLAIIDKFATTLDDEGYPREDFEPMIDNVHDA